MLKVTSCSSKQGNDILDSLVGFVIRGLQFAVGPVIRVWPVMKTAVGQRTTQAFVKKQEQESYLDSLRGELIGVAATVAFQQPVALQFAEIVAKLVQAVTFRGKLESAYSGACE